ncbi:MAG: VOC family protein [bacterium]|nr:VOC family protein [bacterium]
MITRLHSALVDVADFEGAVSDYARLVGFAPVRQERDAAGRRSAFFVFANMALELRACSAEPAAEGEPPRTGQAALRLVWEDGDPTEALAAAGIAVTSRCELRAAAEGDSAEGDRTWTRYALAPEASRRLPVELIVDETPEAGLLGGAPVPVAGAEAREARVHGLDHVVVMSPSPEATRAFYGDGLGIRLALDKTFDERGVRLLFFRLAGLTIEIGARAGADPAPEKADRFGGLAWQVPDVDAIRARLAGEGFDVSEVRSGNKPGTRVCTVRGPVHGVPTLLIEPVQPI